MVARTGALVGVCTAVLTAAFVGAVVFVGLGSEGVRYALVRPDTVLSSSLLVYLVAAALVASGLGYWSVRNWRLLGRRIPDGRL